MPVIRSAVVALAAFVVAVFAVTSPASTQSKPTVRLGYLPTDSDRKSVV